MALGLSTTDALRRLHTDIRLELEKHEKNVEKEERNWLKTKTWKWDAYHHDSNYSMFCWINGLLLLVVTFLLLICYGIVNEPKDHRQLTGAIFIMIITSINIFIVGFDSRLRQHEIQHKAQRLLSFIRECIEKCEWNSSNYPHVNLPLSPCITLQWTYRDGRLINLHWALLVEGDIIALRPGQIVPARCRSLDNNDSCETLLFGDQFVPKLDEAHVKMCYEPRAREPLTTKNYILLETPYINNLRSALLHSCERPLSILDKERCFLYHFWIGHIFVSVIFFASLFMNTVRFIYEPAAFGHWTEMFILLQCQIVIPLLPLMFPILWLILNVYGTSRLHSLFYSMREAKVSLEPWDEYCEIVPAVTNCRISYSSIIYNFCKILTGKSAFACRTANLLHVLGSVTALCCVDKKGILSWPNPTAEKVFFLHTSEPLTELSVGDADLHSSDTNKEQLNIESNTTQVRRRSSNRNKLKSGKRINYTRDSVVEVLDLTHDNQFPFGLQFDDPNWKQYLKSLKPLGLAILLNTCNPCTQESYTQFTSHIAYEVLHNEDAVPVVNRRCVCELARQIGFTEKAMDVFQLQEQLSTFRPLPTAIMRKDRFTKSLPFTKLKFPFPHMVSVVVKEISTGMLQLLSQGTGDIILDSCSDYWDGHDLRPLMESDRKKILDFYHRTSLTSYCTAFAYRPLSGVVHHNFENMYLELPADSTSLYPLVRSPTPTKCWDLQSLNPSTKPWWTQYFSTDSLFCHGCESEQFTDAETCFENQCNQIFIAMVTMQYQARTDVVHLIEYLDKAGIRFVHFSKENELRSRVFSEKMGLESGWNCHISLLSERTRNESGNSNTCNQASSHALNGMVQTNSSVDQLLGGRGNYIGLSPKSRHIAATNRCLSFSAPAVINLECPQVKFGDEISLYHIKDSIGSSMKLNFNGDDNRLDGSCSSVSDNDDDDDDFQEPFLRKCFTATDELSTSRSPSHVTESTEHSAPVGFDMSNRAKLPKGIENIRPHLKNIDNVPLLVSLFTDCKPNATQEMMKIMQENGEVVCCIGSAANCHNMTLFLQANASIAVEPLYPQLCMKQAAFLRPSKSKGPAPVEISHQLNSLTSSLNFYRDDLVSIYHLIMEARHFMIRLRSCFEFMLASTLSISLIQLFAAISFSSPPLNIFHIMWLVCVIIPLLSIPLINNPFSNYITTMATEKTTSVTRKRVLLRFITFVGLKFFPSALAALIIFNLILYDFCVSEVTSVDLCHFVMGNSNFSRPHEWHGWATDYRNNFLLSQNICTSIIVFNLVCISISFVHKYHQLWQKFPFTNKFWCFIVVIVLILQLMYCAIDLNIQSSNEEIRPMNISSISVLTWIVILIWPFILLALNELIKQNEIRSNVRYQKKARLQFGTKLGMNSPF
uniref:Cation-transporting P-type ATPase C-terminal domain-containing protein n=1 Tax=Strigamia maritima TaxID=126957 RepID=T1IVZ1_STRMM